MTTKRWLMLIVITGAALRFGPVWFGLPYLYARPDEEVATGIATKILTGDLNPRFFHWPSLTFYVFAGVYWLVELGGALTDVEYVLVGRIVVACAGTATIVVLFRMARHVADDTTALIAAALLAVAMLHVRDSHFAMTDVLMTLFATSSLGLLLRALDEPDEHTALRWFAAAGLAGGLATSTKYNAAAVAAAMGAAQIVRLARDRRLAALLPSIVYASLFVSAFVLSTPYSVLDFPRFKTDVIYDITHLSEGHAVNLGRGWIYHLRRSLPYGLGPTTFVAAVIGTIALVRKDPRLAFVLGTFAAALYATIGSGYTVFFRYILPLIPVACLAAAIGIRQPFLARRHLSHLLLALTIGPGLVNSVWFDALLARRDSRVIAGEWLEQRLRPHHTLHDTGGKFTSLDLSRADFQQWDFDAKTLSFGDPERTPDWLVLYQSPLFAYVRIPRELRSLAATRYRPVHTVRASSGGRRAAVYDLQDAFFMPLWGFWTVTRPGPTIHIYLRNDLPEGFGGMP